MRRLKTGRRPHIYPKTPGHLPCSFLTHPLPLPSRRPSVSFGGFGLTQMMAGPFCTMLLADMGADVLKIEKPDGGDDIRRAGPPFIKGESAAFLAINRNKRSIVLDLNPNPPKDVLGDSP